MAAEIPSLGTYNLSLGIRLGSSWVAGAIAAGIMAAGVAATKLPNFIPGGAQHAPGGEVREILGE